MTLAKLKMNGSNNLNKVLLFYIISNECLFICVDFRCVANHMQMWLRKKMVISHFGYWHFLSTANTDHIHKVASSIPRHEQGSNSQLQWRQALIAQVVVNPTTILSWPPRPLNGCAADGFIFVTGSIKGILEI
jgi:hypothetical protein